MVVIVGGMASLASCTDSVAPAPSGQLDGGGGGVGGAPVPQGFANDVPRAPAGAPVFGGSTGVPKNKPPAQGAPATTPATNAAQVSNGVGEEFYETAANVGSRGPVGPAFETDRRDPDAAAKYAGEHPPITKFDATAAKSLPAPDANTRYASIVDPAEGSAPALPRPIDLTHSVADIEGVLFSSPAAGQIVLAIRTSGAGQRERTQLERIDLATGKKISEVELPDRAALIDVTADGTRALVRFTFGLAPEGLPASSQTRFDVWELTEAAGQHVVGWEPRTTENGFGVAVDGAFVDGDRVVTLTDDGALTLWDMPAQKATYTIPTGSRGPLLTTPGRKYLAVFTGTTFAAFEAETGVFRGTLTPPRPTLAACLEAAFSPDGAQLATVLRRPAQSILTWDVAAGRPVHEIDAPLGLGKGLHFGSPGYVVAGGVLFDLDRKKPVWLYLENAYSRNVGPSLDRRHWLFSRPAFRETVLEAVDAPIDAVAAAARNAGTLSSPQLGPGDSLAVRIDLSKFTGDRAAFEKQLATALGRTFGQRGIRLDGNAGLTLEVKAERRPTGETIAFNAIGVGNDESVPAHEIQFSLAVLANDSTRVWSGNGRVPPSYFLARQPDKTLEEVLLETLWEAAPTAIAGYIEQAMPTYLRSSPPESVLGQTRLWAGAKDVSPAGGGQLASADGVLSEDDAGDSVPVTQPATRPTLGSAGVRDLMVVPSRDMLVVASDDGNLRTLQASTMRQLDEVRSPNNGATRVALHPSGVYFVFGTEKGEVRAYDFARRRAGAGFDGVTETVTAIAFTSEPMLVVGTQSGRVYRWAENDRSKPVQIGDGQAIVTCVAPVPYANRVLVTWADGTAKLIDAGTGQTVHNIQANAGPLHGAAVSPDAQTALIASDTGGMLVSIGSGQVTERIGKGAVTAVAFRIDGAQMATGNTQGQVILWSTSNREAEQKLDGGGGRIASIVFSSDNQRLAAVVAGRSGVPVWNLNSN